MDKKGDNFGKVIILGVGVDFEALALQYNRIRDKGEPLMVIENKEITIRARDAGKRFLHRMETGVSA